MKKIFIGDWSKMVDRLYYAMLAQGAERGVLVPNSLQNEEVGGDFIVVFNRAEANYQIS